MNMGDNEVKDKKLSVRIFVCDHYLAPKLENFDVSDQFRQPILRIFGATPLGQKCCLHIHNVFPYFYVASPTSEVSEQFLHRFLTELDEALNQSGSNNSKESGRKRQSHVHNVESMKAIPFYGYHKEEETFLKISFNNPLILKKAADVLQEGKVMSFPFQPHELHIPYILQFFIDYDLYGMDFVHLNDFKIRRPSSNLDETIKPAKLNLSFRRRSTPPSQKLFKFTDFPQSMFLPDSVKRMSTCEIEIDCLASDILNPNMKDPSEDVHNPGLKFIWKDEKTRRTSRGLDSQSMIPPPSPKRPDDLPKTESEKYYFPILDEILANRQMLQSSSPDLFQSSFNNSFGENMLDSRDLSLVHLLTDMQTDVATNSNNVNSNLLDEEHENETSDEDDEPQSTDRAEREKREIFEMTQRFVDESSSEDDEMLPQLDGPPAMKRNRAAIEESEIIVLDSSSDDSSLENDIQIISMDILDSPIKNNEAAASSYVWYSSTTCHAPSSSAVADWVNDVGKTKKKSTADTDTQLEESFEKSPVSKKLTPADDNVDAIESTAKPVFTQIRNDKSIYVGRSSSSTPPLSDGFDTFEFTVEDSPSPPKLNEHFEPFLISCGNSSTKKDKRLLKGESQLDGPSMVNSFGFNATSMNLGDVQVNGDELHICVITMELLVHTRMNLNPDPEFDDIRAIFYTVYIKSESLTRIGSLFVDDKTKPLVLKQAKNFCSLNDIEFNIVDCEMDLFEEFVQVIRKFDPDILVGYEIQMSSWGFLIERANSLKIDLCSKLSRIPDESKQSRFSNADDWFALADIYIAGRIVLNLWRLMRHELNLNIYTFESVAYHLLRIRCPKFEFADLTKWFDNASQCTRTLEYFAFRASAQVEFLMRTDLINRTCEFARIFGIQFFDVLSRGSQFRVESMMLRLTKGRNFICMSPSVRQRRKMGAPECIPLNMEPESAFYTDPVLVLDFQSLYPSMCIAYNYCYSTCLGKLRRYNDGSEKIEFGCGTLKVSLNEFAKLREMGEIHISSAGVAFVTTKIRKGVLPIMLEEILDTRFMIKKCMKEYKTDKNLLKILDARQLGLKLIANVTYGYTSANFSGRMPLVEVADSIVHKGRETLERAIDLVNTSADWKAKVIYGDTDSMFVLLKGRSKAEAFVIGQQIADAVTNFNPKPVKLKFEKVYFPCVLQTKKRYVGHAYESVDQQEPTFDAKGIETVRRDTCPAVAKMLEKSLHILFRTKSIDSTRQYVVGQFQRILRGRVAAREFLFAKEYRGRQNYKAENAAVPSLVIAKKKMQMDRRSEPRIKERVPYLIVTGPPGCTLISCVRQPVQSVLGGEYVNYTYYITKQIAPALNRVFSLLGEDVLKWYKSMPRSTRQLYNYGNRKKKTKSRTLSQYFSLSECPVCRKRTVRLDEYICDSCRLDSQSSAVELNARCRTAERQLDAIRRICSCCVPLAPGSHIDDVLCISLECPIFFKRISLRRDNENLTQLRTILNDL